MYRILNWLLVLLFLTSCSSQKKIGGNDNQLSEHLKQHISYLSDDKLEGRRAGSNGEKLAMEYIASQFSSIGLSPKGTDGFFQAFDINDGKQINPATSFSVNGNILHAGKDFFPFPYSANVKLESSPVIGIQESEMPWFFDLKETLDENKANPHFDIENYIYTNAKKARERGASAVLLYNSSNIDDKLVFNAKDKSERLTIPVIYISKEASAKYFNNPSANLSLKMAVDIGEKIRKGHNVVGYIDNNAASTVILGAHFDHLGYGEDGGSLFRTGEKLIHNGADDNASGTSALIELARLLKTGSATKHNYILIAFSGEELGLFGSKYFTEHPTIDLKTVDYMINMDMVGRFNDSTKVLTIGGIGTSPSWIDAINRTANPGFVFKYDSSGTGPSDHTSFYRKDIPVLFYFTGLHSDYHRPTDDADKINYDGAVRVVKHIYGVVQSMDGRPKPVFTKTRETQTSTNASFKVTLGIMPDYTFAGTGVRADGVTEGRPASKAGLKAGDVIIQLGEHVINSLEQYMQALGKFQKGDKAKVRYKRANETLESTVEF